MFWSSWQADEFTSRFCTSILLFAKVCYNILFETSHKYIQNATFSPISCCGKATAACTGTHPRDKRHHDLIDDAPVSYSAMAKLVNATPQHGGLYGRPTIFDRGSCQNQQTSVGGGGMCRQGCEPISVLCLHYEWGKPVPMQLHGGYLYDDHPHGRPKTKHLVHWQGRIFLEPHELAMLQGFPNGFLDWQSLGIRGSQFGALIGNAMMLNILLHLIPNMLRADGILPEDECRIAIQKARAHHPRVGFE